MSRSQSEPSGQLESQLGWGQFFESWFETHSTSTAILLLVIGFVVRLRAAWGTFLNPDEALHFLVANQASCLQAYRASLTTAHPPLLILLLYFLRAFGASEIALRLPSVLAGTAFCWVFFRWLTHAFGPAAGWIGFIFATFLPPMIQLSAEVRQYALLLFFTTAAAYFLDRAFSRNSAGAMWLSAICLYLGMLSHYSAFLFAGALGVYGLLRVARQRFSKSLTASWVAGQIGALAIIAALYWTHLARQRASPQTIEATQDWLRRSYFHPGQDNLLLFVLGRSFGVFQFIFGQLAVGDVAGLLFIAGIVFLLRQKSPRHERAQFAVLLVLPFLINCAAAIFGLYPYGGTRHAAFLTIFALAGVSLSLAGLLQQRIASSVALAIVFVIVCHLFGNPHRPYMLRSDQSSGRMSASIAAIRQQVSPDGTIFVDYQTSLLLGHYLCQQRPISRDPSPADFDSFPCTGYRVISAGPRTWKFTSEIFLHKWNGMLQSYNLKPGETVWIIQEGWEINLAAGLESNFPEFHDLNPEFFGKSISMFKLVAGQPMPAASN